MERGVQQKINREQSHMKAMQKAKADAALSIVLLYIFVKYKFLEPIILLLILLIASFGVKQIIFFL